MKRKITQPNQQSTTERPLIRELDPRDLQQLVGGNDTHPHLTFRGFWGSYRKYRQ